MKNPYKSIRIKKNKKWSDEVMRELGGLKSYVLEHVLLDQNHGLSDQ